jgi:hypothetical protein
MHRRSPGAKAATLTDWADNEGPCCDWHSKRRAAGNRLGEIDDVAPLVAVADSLARLAAMNLAAFPGLYATAIHRTRIGRHLGPVGPGG